MLPGLTTVVPAVCPYWACRAVWGGPPGWTLFVFTATLRPFTETDVNSTVSGPDLRGLAREERILPKAFVPAFNKTFPFTETSWAIFASKLLPTTSCAVRRLTVVTVTVVPAGIVAAFKDKAAKHPQIIAMTVLNLFRVILV